MVSTDFYKQVVERFETRRLRHDFSNDLRNKVFCTPAAALHAMLFVRRHMALGAAAARRCAMVPRWRRRRLPAASTRHLPCFAATPTMWFL
jgi:hypothetical protein